MSIFRQLKLERFQVQLECMFLQTKSLHESILPPTRSMHHPFSDKIHASSFLRQNPCIILPQQNPCTILPPTKSMHHPSSNKIPASSYLQQNPCIILPTSNKIHASSFLLTKSLHHLSNKIPTPSFRQQDPCTIHSPTKSMHHPSSNKIRTSSFPQKWLARHLPFPSNSKS